jgi:dTDP-4-dehydrorhamnose reductase
MKALILGGSGMLGHKLWQEFSQRFDTYVTFREDFATYSKYGIFDVSRSRCLVSVDDNRRVENVIEELQPDVVINCIGIVKQSDAAKDPVTSIPVNSHFPHQVAHVCRKARCRLIHISTDCVFSGLKGNYTEEDRPDPVDLYGRTKLEGEVSGKDCMTIRTSMIGRELRKNIGLIEWFLSQRGKSVDGWKRAIFSGLTTIEIARIIARIIQDHRELEGVWHVASNPISKFDLLSLVKEVYDLEVEIIPDDKKVIDRSLNADRFQKTTGYHPPSWREMIEEMHQDPTPYSELRRSYADR